MGACTPLLMLLLLCSVFAMSPSPSLLPLALRYCLVLEYMDGGNLWEALRRHPERVTFLDTAMQIARGLKYLHESARLVHRDLKSPNILLRTTGEVKIADFGLTCLGDANAVRGWSAQGGELDEGLADLEDDMACPHHSTFMVHC